MWVFFLLFKGLSNSGLPVKFYHSWNSCHDRRHFEINCFDHRDFVSLVVVSLVDLFIIRVKLQELWTALVDTVISLLDSRVGF